MAAHASHDPAEESTCSEADSKVQPGQEAVGLSFWLHS